MPHPSSTTDSEPPASVRDLMAELFRVKAAIRRVRRRPAAAAGAGTDVAGKELLALYAQERAVVRALRGRHRRWRAETGLSDAQLHETDSTADQS